MKGLNEVINQVINLSETTSESSEVASKDMKELKELFSKSGVSKGQMEDMVKDDSFQEELRESIKQMTRELMKVKAMQSLKK